MSSATGRKPTDAANPVNAQHLPDCSTADSPAPQALSTPFLPTLPRQATPDVLPPIPYRPSLPFYPSACHRPVRPRLTFSRHNLPPSLFVV